MENNNVLFVDDEINILAAIRRGLIDEQYTCFYANSGEEAVKIMEQKEIHVIVTDMKMPKMDGLELLKYVKQNHPDIVKIVLSGYAQLPQIIATINHIDIFKFILKPWKLEEELKVAINEAIKAYNLKYESLKLKKELHKKNELYQSILKSTGAKFDIIKKDFENVKKINAFMNNHIKEIVVKMENSENHKKTLLNEINLIEELSRDFFNTLPSEFTDFSIEKLYKEVNNYITNLKEEQNIQIQIVEGIDLNFYGNYRVICLIIKFLVEYIVNNIDSNLIKLNLAGKKNDGTIDFIFFAEIIDDKIGLKNKLVKDNFNKIIAVLQSLAEASNGKLILREKEQLYITIFKVICYNR